MSIRFVQIGWEGNVLRNAVVDAVTDWLEQAAPCSLWEEEVSLVLSEVLCVDTGLESRTNHDVVSDILVSTSLIGELKEHGFVESVVGVVGKGHLGHLSVVITDETILALDGSSHEISVGVSGVKLGVIESPGLLWVTPAGAMITREGIKGSHCVPSGTELLCCAVSSETANISSNKGDTEHVHAHDLEH
jgi:hypothetical protein